MPFGWDRGPTDGDKEISMDTSTFNTVAFGIHYKTAQSAGIFANKISLKKFSDCTDLTTNNVHKE